jgi:hypothetical protein
VSYCQRSWVSIWVVNGSVQKPVATMGNLDLGTTTTKRGILFFQRLMDFDVRKRTCGGLCTVVLNSNQFICSVIVREGLRKVLENC